jgi:hypothetical protein
MLEKFKTRWVVELPSILLSLRTTLTLGTGYTPFFMVHGSEAVLPIDIDYRSPKVRAYTYEGNQVSLEDAIDQLNEALYVALLHSAWYQQSMRRYHGRAVRERAFQVRDLVLHRVQSNKDRHKLSLPWEGPFIVDQILRPDIDKFKDEDDRPITNTWNIEHLCHFYT